MFNYKKLKKKISFKLNMKYLSNREYFCELWNIDLNLFLWSWIVFNWFFDIGVLGGYYNMDSKYSNGKSRLS